MLKLQKATPLTDLDEVVFSRIVPQDHYLRLVAAHVDFERFRTPLEQAYLQSGRPPIDPVRMLKIQYLGFHYNLSGRRVMARAQTDLASRWVLQLGTTDTPADHASAPYFRR